MENNKKIAGIVAGIVVLAVIVTLIYKNKDKETPKMEQETNTPAEVEVNANMASVQPAVRAAAPRATQPAAQITLLAPVVRNGEVESGDLSVEWRSTNVAKVTVSVVDATGKVLVGSNEIDASLGRYVIDLPKSEEGSNTKYRVAVMDTANRFVVNSGEFTIEK
ncbi:MAG TPA: hypothetical protein VEC13_02620 [Candidatus Paceibacterota bacterium]|nr:hypothetical protein [Candidatus Paceibacterota bacterium]